MSFDAENCEVEESTTVLSCTWWSIEYKWERNGCLLQCGPGVVCECGKKLELQTMHEWPKVMTGRSSNDN